MLKTTTRPMLHVERFLIFQYLNPLLTPSPASNYGQRWHSLDRAYADAPPGSKSLAVSCMPGQSSWIQRCTAKTFTRTVFAKGKAIHFLPDNSREALRWTLTEQGQSLCEWRQSHLSLVPGQYPKHRPRERLSSLQPVYQSWSFWHE